MSGRSDLPVSPSLDESSEPWLGRFPGLGAVMVWRDGTVEVVVDEGGAGREPPELREQALRYGWGEPLSFVRRGLRCLGGIAVVAPGADPGCLVIHGSLHETDVLTLEMAAQGWAVLADRVVPTEWVGADLVAHPRRAPVVVARRRAEQAQLGFRAVRTQSDAVAVEVARSGEKHRVRALAMISARRPHEEVLRTLTGHRRFEAATGVVLGGPLFTAPADGADPLPRTAMAEHLRLAALPHAHLAMSRRSVRTDVAALTEWWVREVDP